jgi:hypothetical protein
MELTIPHKINAGVWEFSFLVFEYNGERSGSEWFQEKE